MDDGETQALMNAFYKAPRFDNKVEKQSISAIITAHIIASISQVNLHASRHYLT